MNNTGWSDGVPTRWEPPRHLSPVERSDAASAVDTLRRQLTPAEDREFDAAMMRLRLHCRNAPKAEGKALALVLDDYRRLLADLPADLLDSAVDRYVSRPEPPFWPSVGELLALGEGALRERRNMLARAEKLAAGGDERPRRYQPTGEERKRMADGFKAAADVLRNMPGPVA